MATKTTQKAPCRRCRAWEQDTLQCKFVACQLQTLEESKLDQEKVDVFCTQQWYASISYASIDGCWMEEAQRLLRLELVNHHRDTGWTTIILYCTCEHNNEKRHSANRAFQFWCHKSSGQALRRRTFFVSLVSWSSSYLLASFSLLAR